MNKEKSQSHTSHHIFTERLFILMSVFICLCSSSFVHLWEVWLSSPPPQCKAQRDSVQMDRMLCHSRKSTPLLLLFVDKRVGTLFYADKVFPEITLEQKYRIRCFRRSSPVNQLILSSWRSHSGRPVPAAWMTVCCTCHLVQAAAMAGDKAVTCWHFIWVICDAALRQTRVETSCVQVSTPPRLVVEDARLSYAAVILILSVR